MIRLPVGKKHVEILSRWIPSLVTFGGAGSLTLLYLTDWKLILQFVPFYNGKFVKEEEE